MFFIWRKIILHSQKNSHCLLLQMGKYYIFLACWNIKVLEFPRIESLPIHKLMEAFVPIVTVLMVESQIELRTY